MPRRSNYHEPDAIDCHTMASALGADFGCLCDITTRYQADEVIVLVRCHKGIDTADHVVLVQAIVRRPLRAAHALYAMQYSALLDCWHQLDRGTLAAAARPIERGWDGRPRQPRSRNAQ